MGETRTQYIPNISIPTEPMPYPRYIGEVISHPFTPNTLLEVLAVWNRNEVWGEQAVYATVYNPIVRDWNTAPPRRDESSKYPIYRCRVNGVNDQWIVFTWIPLDENRPTDILGYSSARVGG